MDLVIKLLYSPWFWVDIVLSVSGGVIVWWGLKVEKKAEDLLPPEDFRPDIFDDIVKRQKSELKRGWRILMTGIVVEVLAALGISIISSIEIAALEEKSSASMLEAKQASKDAAAANERAASTESNNLVLQTKLVELEEKQKWRTITAAQESNIVNFLKSAPRIDHLNISAEQGDLEATEYARRIFDVLKNSGFNPFLQLGTQTFNPNTPLGVDLVFDMKDIQHPSSGAEAIFSAFNAAGVGKSGGESSVNDENTLWIHVIPKTRK